MKKEEVKIHTQKDFEGMRRAGRFNAQLLDYLSEFIKPGISTAKINSLCHKYTVDHGHIPAPLNYHGFPASVCTSVNHVVCHGIPSEEKILKDGDIINIDCTTIVDGYYGDSSRTFMIGSSFLKNSGPSQKAKKLTQVTFECMMLGIEQVKPGNKISDIGRAIQKHAESNGFSVVRDYCGHGIGKVMHTSPAILHYVPKDIEEEKYDMELKEGMFFTIEPMINAGAFQTILSKIDGWTVTTKDKSLSAQFEHTIGVTKSGYEIFTLSLKNVDFPKIAI